MSLYAGTRPGRLVADPSRSSTRSPYKASLLGSWHLPIEGEIETPAAGETTDTTVPADHVEGSGVTTEEGIKKNIWIRDLLLEASSGQ